MGALHCDLSDTSTPQCEITGDEQHDVWQWAIFAVGSTSVHFMLLQGVRQQAVSPLLLKTAAAAAYSCNWVAAKLRLAGCCGLAVTTGSAASSLSWILVVSRASSVTGVLGGCMLP